MMKMKYGGLFFGCILLVLSCGAVGCSDSKGAASEVKGMTSIKEQAAKILNLPDTDFFSFDEDKQLALQEALSALVEDDDGGPDTTPSEPSPLLIIDTPERISMDEHKTVPLLIGHQESGLRGWQVRYKANLHVFVRNLSTGDLYIARPLVSMRRGKPQLLSGAGEPPDDFNANTVHSSVTVVDLQTRLDGRLAPGRYMITAAAFDLPSNSVPMRLVKKDAPPVARLKYPQPYILYALEEGSELQREVNIPAKASVDDDGFIYVAIQVGKNAGVLKSPQEETFWSGALILVKLDAPPVIIPVTTPVQAVAVAQGATMYNAVFRVLLNEVAKIAGAGDFKVYLDAGLEVLGPYPLTITDGS